MNRKISLISSVTLAISIITFFISLALSFFISNPIVGNISYLSCIILSWTYLLTIVGYSRSCTEDKIVAIEAGKIFGIIYTIFVNIVYFAQLTAVQQKVLDISILNSLSFEYPGSLLFSFDLIGYGILAISTFFVGLTIEVKNRNDKILKLLLLFHGIFAVCIFLPMTSLFIADNNSGNSGIFALMAWCLIFISIPILFYKKIKESKEL